MVEVVNDLPGAFEKVEAETTKVGKDAFGVGFELVGRDECGGEDGCEDEG